MKRVLNKLKTCVIAWAVTAPLVLGGCATAPEEPHWLGDIPADDFDKVMRYLQQRLYEFDNRDIVTLIDYSKHSSEPRMYVVNLKAQTVDKYRVAHGQGSDLNHDGWLDAFGHAPGSKMSPNGFFRVAEQYSGQHGASLRMDGLDPQNENARERAIVIHGASYMSPILIRRWTKPGRSWGCPAVYGDDMEKLYTQLPGSLLYIMDDLPAMAMTPGQDGQKVASLDAGE